MSKLRGLKYDLLEHPPYSPDLAPSDFCLFPNLKKFVAGKRFSSNEEIIAAVEGSFTDVPESYFKTGIKLLEKNVGPSILCWGRLYRKIKSFL